ncbi:MAG: carbohydrate kinase family protein, partial [Anaerolineales bacterium]|nr:carbohydrate kinase family protein [Anaerolineales bacterium]
MSDLLVIGGASLDRLHLAGGPVDSAGGAGLYTALAAHRSGARVAMLAPRPEPCPAVLQPLADRLSRWHGPAVSPANLPHFEIAYPDGRTIYLQADFGAIPHLTPEMLPADLAQFSLVHVTPLGDPARQLAFIHACRQRGSQRIAAGTSFVFIENQAATIREIIAAVDYFFMNEREAVALFGD